MHRVHLPSCGSTNEHFRNNADTVTPAQTEIPCKVCGTPAPLWDSCDFNTHCMRPTEPDLLPPAGIAVDYHRCPACGFLFTPYMDDFTQADFRARVYNADYHLFDPGFEEERPTEFAQRLLGHFGDLPLNICDYGGGRGRMASIINSAGRTLRAKTWDPFFNHQAMPDKTFDLVVSFEVFEHSPTPAHSLAQMLKLTDANRLILLSTLCQPPDIDAQRLTWWYCAPRNGHISLHTNASLDYLADQAGIAVAHFGVGTHLFYDVIPDWIAPYFR